MPYLDTQVEMSLLLHILKFRAVAQNTEKQFKLHLTRVLFQQKKFLIFTGHTLTPQIVEDSLQTRASNTLLLFFIMIANKKWLQKIQKKDWKKVEFLMSQWRQK